MSERTLTGISSMATRHVLADLAEDAAAAGLGRVEITSMGGVDAAARVSGGEASDLVILDEAAPARLADAGHVDPATARPIVVSHVAVGVAGTPSTRTDATLEPAFEDVDHLREALLASESIGYSTGPSGRAVVEMIRNLGIHDDVADRLVLARPGVPVADLLASGDVSIGFQQLSELAGHPRVRVLGVLPAEVAIVSTFSGAVATSSTQPGAARAVLDRWSSPEVTPIKTTHSFVVKGDTP